MKNLTLALVVLTAACTTTTSSWRATDQRRDGEGTVERTRQVDHSVRLKNPVSPMGRVARIHVEATAKATVRERVPVTHEQQEERIETTKGYYSMFFGHGSPRGRLKDEWMVTVIIPIMLPCTIVDSITVAMEGDRPTGEFRWVPAGTSWKVLPTSTAAESAPQWRFTKTGSHLDSFIAKVTATRDAVEIDLRDQRSSFSWSSAKKTARSHAIARLGEWFRDSETLVDRIGIEPFLRKRELGVRVDTVQRLPNTNTSWDRTTMPFWTWETRLVDQVANSSLEQLVAKEVHTQVRPQKIILLDIDTFQPVEKAVVKLRVQPGIHMSVLDKFLTEKGVTKASKLLSPRAKANDQSLVTDKNGRATFLSGNEGSVKFEISRKGYHHSSGEIKEVGLRPTDDGSKSLLIPKDHIAILVSQLGQEGNKARVEIRK